jgi:twitching motility protein PilT
VLKAVISMRLIPRADGHGRVPAVEVMITTPFIRDCIINKDKTKLIHEAIAAGVSQYGMQTFDQSIFQLYKKELISYDEALRRASNPDEFKLKIQGIQSASDMAAEEMEQTMQSFDLET